MSGKDTGVALSDIYSFISEKYPFYKMKNKGWQNAIRHTLSLTKGFVKSHDSNKGRRGCNWSIRDGFKYGDLKSFHGGKSISLRELINKKSLGSQQATESGKRCVAPIIAWSKRLLSIIGDTLLQNEAVAHKVEDASGKPKDKLVEELWHHYEQRHQKDIMSMMPPPCSAPILTRVRADLKNCRTETLKKEAAAHKVDMFLT